MTMLGTNRNVERLAAAAAIGALFMVTAALPPLPIASGGGMAVAETVHGLEIDPGSESLPFLEEWLDPRALLADLEADGVVSLRLAGLALDVVLEPNDLRAPGYRAYVVAGDGTVEQVEDGPLGTFRGQILGDESSSSRFTIVQGYVNGFVDHPGLGRISVETVLPPVRDEQGRLLHHVFWEAGTPTGKNQEQGGSDPSVGSAGEYVTPPWEEYALGFLAGWTRPSTYRDFRAATDSDAAFYVADPANWRSRQAAILNNAEAMYDSQVRIRWSLSAQFTHTSGSDPTSSNGCAALLDAFETRWQTDPVRSATSRHFVVALAQRDLTGSTIGCASSHGGIQNPTTEGYAVVQTKDLSSTAEKKVAEHEIGHLFNAWHHYAKKWRSASCFWLCTKTTVMWKTLGSGTMDKFSEGDDYWANAYRVRKCAEDTIRCKSMPLPSPNMLWV